MNSRTTRTLRAMTAALVSTFVAAFSHVLGGGAAPGAVTIGLALAAAALVCLVLSSRALSVWRLCLSVALSQFGFHTLFAITGSSAMAAPHLHGGTAGMEALPDMSGSSGSSMWLSHLLAAAVTTAALLHGERVLKVLLQLARLVLRPLLSAPGGLVVAPSAPRPAQPTHRHRVQPMHHLLGTCSRRGPPLSV